MNALQLHLTNSPIGLSDLDELSLAALLWGYRHRLWGFESLVHYAERNYVLHGDLLDDLAILEKNKYSESGAEILQNLQLACVTDTVEAHQQSADEVFALLFRRLHAEASAQQLLAVFNELSSDFLFCREEEWTGYDPLAPYLHDRGPRQELLNLIVRFNALLNKTGATPQLWESLTGLCQPNSDLAEIERPSRSRSLPLACIYRFTLSYFIFSVVFSFVFFRDSMALAILTPIAETLRTSLYMAPLIFMGIFIAKSFAQSTQQGHKARLSAFFIWMGICSLAVLWLLSPIAPADEKLLQMQKSAHLFTFIFATCSTLKYYFQHSEESQKRA